MQQEKANMFWCMKTLNDRRRRLLTLDGKGQPLTLTAEQSTKYQADKAIVKGRSKKYVWKEQKTGREEHQKDAIVF